MLNLAFAALSFSAAATPADVRLAWKFHEGEIIRYRILQDIQQTISGMGTMETSTRTGQVLREKVQSVASDGTAKIEVTWEALRFHMAAPMGGGDMDYDSTKDAPESAPAPLKGLAKVVGSAFQLEMKPTGEIVSLHGIDDLMQKIGSGSESGPMGSVVAKSFNDASMKRALETLVLPEKEVADGGSWKRSSQFDVPSLGKMKIDFDFKLDGTEEIAGSKCAKVGVVYAMSLGDGKPDMSGMPGAQQFDIDLSMEGGDGQGTIHFSPELGRMVQTKIASDMDLNMNLKPKGDAKGAGGEGMKLAVRVHQQLATSLLGAKDPAFEAEAKAEPKTEPKK